MYVHALKRQHTQNCVRVAPPVWPVCGCRAGRQILGRRRLRCVCVCGISHGSSMVTQPSSGSKGVDLSQPPTNASSFSPPSLFSSSSHPSSAPFVPSCSCQSVRHDWRDGSLSLISLLLSSWSPSVCFSFNQIKIKSNSIGRPTHI